MTFVLQFTVATLELGEECSRTLGPGMDWLPEQLGLQADACNRGTAVEA